MRFHLAVLVLLVAALFATTACNKSTNPQMQAPPEVYTPSDTSAPQLATAKDPKVNILFVVDNSQSMDAHQEMLKRNIDQFANQFFNNPRIDFKIGVVPVYDRRFLNDTSLYNYYETVNGKRVIKNGPRKMNQLGVLVPLKGKDGETLEGAPYITRDTPNAKEVLKNTVRIGTQWGPEAEESFSPVLEVIGNDSLNQQANAGFYDKDAHLVVIFLTDADDVTPEVTPYSFYESLVQAKGGDTEKVILAAALPGAKRNSASCRLDGNGPQYKFPQLMSIAEGVVADLCSSSFGEKLALLGEQMVQKVGAQRIKLGYTPDVNLMVTYGTADTPVEKRQVIPRNAKTGYYFNPRTTEIVLSPNMKIDRVPGGQIFVTAIPVNYANLNNGRLTTTADPIPAPAPGKKK